MNVFVNPPKTPVHEGSSDLAAATLPNVCKMPGPPAPFVPSPLPNIGKSGDRLQQGTTKVLFEGKKIAIEGSYYMSMGDMASKATGGGLLNGATHGKTEFTAPGSTNVKAQGKNIQLLGDAMTNNGGTKGTGATLPGNVQEPGSIAEFQAAVGKSNALKLCKAACAAIRNKTKKNKYQNLMRDALDPRPRGMSNKVPSQILTEVAQQVGKAGKFIGRWGSAVGTGVPFVKWDIVIVKAGLTLAKKGLSSLGQIKKIVEVKFPGDSGTANQMQMANNMGKSGSKVVLMDPTKCCACAGGK